MKQIGEYFGIEVAFDIEEKDDNESTVTSSATEIKYSTNVEPIGRAKYSLNGGEPQNKRRTVHSVVSLYMKLHPRVTWREVLDIFPKELQGSYGVVNAVENIQYRIKKGLMMRIATFLALLINSQLSTESSSQSATNGADNLINSANMSRTNSVGLSKSLNWNMKRIEKTMTIDDIKTLVAADESRTLELKKTTGELKDGMHSACAFLNTEGGWLILVLLLNR